MCSEEATARSSRRAALDSGASKRWAGGSRRTRMIRCVKLLLRRRSLSSWEKPGANPRMFRAPRPGRTSSRASSPASPRRCAATRPSTSRRSCSCSPRATRSSREWRTAPCRPSRRAARSGSTGARSRCAPRLPRLPGPRPRHVWTSAQPLGALCDAGSWALRRSNRPAGRDTSSSSTASRTRMATSRWRSAPSPARAAA